MNRRIYIYTLLLMLSVCLGGYAQKVSESEAYSNVLEFIGQNEALAKSRDVKVLPKLSFSGKVFYAYDYGNSFILASSDPLKPAIIGYSDCGDFSSAYKSPCFRYFLRQYEQEYRSDFVIFKPADVAEVVEPLCHDVWHQYTPFNDMCPLAPDGENHCVTGCVATSMAELMNYYKYPVQGTGYLEYNDSTGSGLVLSTDLDSHSYDWSKILDDYNYSYTAEEGNAVAQLMYDCGVAVKMRYDPDASGASVIHQPLALVNNFGYDEGMQLYYRNFFNQVEWDSIMFHELDAGRPMLIGGWDGGGGHSLLCDGYDSNGLFHLRWGYPEAQANGYYYFTWMTPDLPEWRDVNSPEIGLNALQSILVGVKPKVGTEPSPQHYIYCFSYIKNKDGGPCTVRLGETAEIGVYDLSNCGWNEHSGKVGIALKRLDSGRMTPASSTNLLYTYDRRFALEELTDSIYSDTLSVKIPSDLTEGNYKLVPVYEENGSYIEARTMLGIPNYLSLDVIGNEVKIYEPEDGFSRLSISDVVFPEVIYRQSCPHYGFTLKNSGADYSGRLYISLYDDKNPTYNRVFSVQGVTIGRDVEQRYEFVRTNIYNFPLGDFHLRIMSDESLLNDSLNVLYDNPEIIIKVESAPTAIESTGVDSEVVYPIRYYDLSGREITDVSRIHSGSIYIEVMSDGKVRKVSLRSN